MKLLLLIFSLLSLFSYNQEEKFPKHFHIGEHSYEMKIQKRYNHDDDVTATYFVVNRRGSKKNQISSHKITRHNGQTTIIGSYQITKRFIEFKEVYSDRSVDSMRKRFYPNTKGNLILTEYTEYKNGVGTRTKL